MKLFESVQIGNNLSVARVTRCVNGVPPQCVIQGTFTDFTLFQSRRHFEVRDDAAVLRAFPGDPIELGLGQFELPFCHRDQRLDRALAKGLAPDDQSSPVILDGGGENF